MYKYPFFLYDPEDEWLVKKYCWHKKKGKTTSYVVRHCVVNRRRCAEYFHRAIMNPPQGFEIDHINHNGLDNRKLNLRIVTRQINVFNNTLNKSVSGYKGVSKNGNGWQAYLPKKNKRLSLGTYFTPEEAFAVAEKARLEYINRLLGANQTILVKQKVSSQTLVC